MQKIPPDLNLPSNFTSQGARQLLTCWWKVEVFVAQLCPTLLGPYGFVAHQAPLSVGFSRQDSWSGLPLLAATCSWFEMFSIIFLISGFFSIFCVRISIYCLVSRNPFSNWMEGKPFHGSQTCCGESAFITYETISQSLQGHPIQMCHSEEIWKKHGPAEEGMANYSSKFTMRTSWPVWKLKKIWHWKMRFEFVQYATVEEQMVITLNNSSRKNEVAGPKWKWHSVMDVWWWK